MPLFGGANFGNTLIGALETGKESKRRQLRDAWELEDRAVENEILTHRLRELKLQESLQKRAAAIQNLGLMQGTPESDIPDSMAEGADSGFGPIPQGAYSGEPLATVPGSIQMQRRFRPQEIPGIPELGLGGFQMRPQTYEQSMERQIGDLITKKRAEAMWTPQRASRGGVVTLPATGEVLAKGDPYQSPDQYTTTVTRDAQGRTIRTLVPRAEAVGVPQVQEPLPLRPRAAGNGGLGQGGDVEYKAMLDAIMRGDDTIRSVPKSALGVRMRNDLAKAGFNSRIAEADDRAIQTFYGSMNSEKMNELRATAASTKAALDDLEEYAKDWGGSGWGPLSSATLALGRRGHWGPNSAEKAKNIDNAIKTVVDGLAVIGANGSAPNDARLKAAATALNSGNWSAEGTIPSLKKALAYRTGAIEGLEPITPSGAGGGAGRVGGTDLVNPPNPSNVIEKKIPDGAAPGVAQTGAMTPAAVAAMLKRANRANDPETVKKVMASPQALQQLIALQPK